MDIRSAACLKVRDIEESFLYDGYHIAGLPEILSRLSAKQVILVLENIDVEIERRIVNLRPLNQSESNNGFVSAVKNYFFNRLAPSDSSAINLKSDYYVVHKKTLENKLELYWSNDYQIVREKCFGKNVFVSKSDMIAWLQGNGESLNDCNIILYSLIERSVVFPDKMKDEFGRLVKGYVFHNPQSKDYKVHITIQKLRDNITFMEKKCKELKENCQKLDEEIKSYLKCKNKEAAKVLGRNKIRIEKDLVYIINQKTVLESNLDHLIESSQNGFDSEAWKLSNELIEEKMNYLEEFKEGIIGLKQLKEKDKEVYDMVDDDDKDEEKEIQEELNRIENQIYLQDALEKGSRNTQFDEEPARNQNLLINPFPTTTKKSEPITDSRDEINNANNTPFESFFGGNRNMETPKENQNVQKPSLTTVFEISEDREQTFLTKRQVDEDERDPLARFKFV